MFGAVIALTGCQTSEKKAATVEAPTVTPTSSVTERAPVQPPPPAVPVDVDALAAKCAQEDMEACKLACANRHARSCTLWGLKARMEEMKGKAKKGTAVAAHKQACELGDGFGCYESQDYEKGLTLMTAQCEKDDALACRTLGFAKNSGRHTPKNDKVALSLFSKACKLGDETGCINEKRLESEK